MVSIKLLQVVLNVSALMSTHRICRLVQYWLLYYVAKAQPISVKPALHQIIYTKRVIYLKSARLWPLIVERYRPKKLTFFEMLFYSFAPSIFHESFNQC